MLKEFFHYFFTPAPAIARKRGYLYCSISLAERYERNKKLWAPHLNRCHQFILKNLPASPGKIIVFGSGHLLEIPWASLLQRCQELILVDIVHPRKVLALAKRERKISLITQDITGYYLNHGGEFSPPRMGLKGDVAISANILSQLPLIPWESCAGDEGQEKLIAEKMKKDHLSLLAEVAPSVLLFSDTKRIFRDKNAHVIEEIPSAITLNESSLEQWTWEICPIGELSRKYSMEMVVEAYRP